jgi:hypothetical protein
MPNELRCIHRHTYREHPRCFENGVPRVRKVSQI